MRIVDARHLYLAAAVLLVGAILLLGVPQWRACTAGARLSDHEWSTTASRWELRNSAHQALACWAADPHDAFITLIEVGDRSSVPYLRTALAKAPRTDIVDCTWQHGREALTKAQRTNVEPAGRASPDGVD